MTSSFSFKIIFTDGRTPWTSDQLVARPLPKHTTAQTQNKHIHTPNIHALSGIRTQDPSVRASEDSSCLRPLGYCDRQLYLLPTLNSLILNEHLGQLRQCKAIQTQHARIDIFMSAACTRGIGEQRPINDR
jgi:hypothetical protein